MSLDGLFELLALQDQPGAGADPVTERRRDAVRRWCAEYGARWSWSNGAVDLLGACGPGSGWHGAPTAAPNTVLDTAAMLVRPLSAQALLIVSGAMVWPWPVTGQASGAAGRTLLVAGLLDEHAAGLAPFSAVCSPLLTRTARLRAAVAGHRTPGVALGSTGERFVAIPALVDFAVYSAAPLDHGTRCTLVDALAGWTGHLRLQAPAGAGSGLFMAWQWHGDDPSTWSTQADRTLAVLQAVRDALVDPGGRA